MARMTIPSGDFRPAQGLQRLTWPQVEKIDDLVSSLCAYASQGDDHESIILPIYIEINRNGRPVKIAGTPVDLMVLPPILREVFKPTRG